MSEGQRLFSLGKIGVFIDSYAPNVEKRRGDEVSVLVVKGRVQPFDSKLASALDEGVGGDSNIRPTVFSLNSGDPKQNFTRHDFRLGLARQNLELFASPDTNVSRIVLSQAKISGTYVRTQKDMNALAFVFKFTFGPVSRDELELIHSLHRLQTFISFAESEPLLDVEESDDDEDDDEQDDDDEDADEVHARPEPMFDDPRDQEGPTAREVGARRGLHSHRGRKKTAKKRSGRSARA